MSSRGNEQHRSSKFFHLPKILTLLCKSILSDFYKKLKSTSIADDFSALQIVWILLKANEFRVESSDLSEE